MSEYLPTPPPPPPEREIPQIDEEVCKGENGELLSSYIMRVARELNRFTIEWAKWLKAER